MKKIRVILGTAVLVSLLGFSSFAAITTTPKGVQKLDSADIVDALNNNADVLDNHVDKIATSDILGHIKIGTGLQVSEDGTASVKIANDFNTDDSETALSAAKGAEFYNSFKTYSKGVYGVGAGYKDGSCYFYYNFPISYDTEPTVVVDDYHVDNELWDTTGTCTVNTVTKDYVVFQFTKNQGQFIANSSYTGCKVDFTVTSND